MASLLKKLGGYKQQSDHKAPLRPKAVLLDVNGTLFPATSAAPAFKELGLDEGLVEVCCCSLACACVEHDRPQYIHSTRTCSCAGDDMCA